MLLGMEHGAEGNTAGSRQIAAVLSSHRASRHVAAPSLEFGGSFFSHHKGTKPPRLNKQKTSHDSSNLLS